METACLAACLTRTTQTREPGTSESANRTLPSIGQARSTAAVKHASKQSTLSCCSPSPLAQPAPCCAGAPGTGQGGPGRLCSPCVVASAQSRLSPLGRPVPCSAGDPDPRWSPRGAPSLLPALLGQPGPLSASAQQPARCCQHANLGHRDQHIHHEARSKQARGWPPAQQLQSSQ